MNNIRITHIDTACILLEINGYKILTDPTLDKAGNLYYHGSGTFSRKTESPALNSDDLKEVELVLLSHHQHKDNFDIKGKEFALTVPTILSTAPASKAIPGITGLDDWESYSITTTKVPGLKITATPAQHHPWWVPEFLAGKVIGFVIEFAGQENGVIYISGDTVFFKGIHEIAQRFKIDTAIIHVGSVQFRYLTGFGKYTMDSKDLVRTAEVLNPQIVIPVHHHGWSHFKEKEYSLRRVIKSNSKVSEKTIFLTSGLPFRLK